MYCIYVYLTCSIFSTLISSHGVWGLDDYHCLLFLFGSAQLSAQKEIKPSDIHDKNVLASFSSEYLYLEGISFIRAIKSSAPFSETSPMVCLYVALLYSPTSVNYYSNCYRMYYCLCCKYLCLFS